MQDPLLLTVSRNSYSKAYNRMTIRVSTHVSNTPACDDTLASQAANLGATDGIDVDGTNLYLHDIEVTNRDECISIKSPMKDATIERIRYVLRLRPCSLAVAVT